MLEFLFSIIPYSVISEDSDNNSVHLSLINQIISVIIYNFAIARLKRKYTHCIQNPILFAGLSIS